MNKENKKIKKTKALLKENTNILIFFFPSLCFLALIIYILLNELNIFSLLYIFVGILLFIPGLQSYFGKQIVITEKKFYIYENKVKFFTGSFIDDFYFIDLKQNFIQKILNFGTIIIVKKDKSFYRYSYLNNAKIVYETFILQYENIMYDLDNNFVKVFHEKLEKLEISENNNISEISENASIVKKNDA